MKSSLICSLIVLAFRATLVSGFRFCSVQASRKSKNRIPISLQSSSGLVQSAAIVVLVANGSDITINLPGEYSHNRLLNVVSDSGNNNPSVFDWVGGNGANKAPRLSIGGGNQGSNGGGGRGGGIGAAVIDALWKAESSTAAGAGQDDEYVDSGESEESKKVTIMQTTNAAETTTARSLAVASGATRTTLNTWHSKYVTAALNHPD